MRGSVQSLILLSGVVPLACLAVDLLAPALARAGCDYPTHVERTPVDPVPVNTPAAPKSDPRQPSKPCPCTSPSCSRQPFAPLAPSSLKSLTAPEWGHLIPRPLHVPPQNGTRLPEDKFPLPARHAFAIYHPPRLPV
jgi:hypothetical protein